MFKKILIANRGEIAVRVMRACRELGIKTVAIYSDIDKDALHTKYADEAFHIGGSLPQESYLNIDKIIQVAKETNSEAIHPGYGFLAENPKFAAAAEEAKIKFIGPPSKAIALMGDKLVAKKEMNKAGVPVVPGILDEIKDTAELKKMIQEIGYPILLKPAAGGGGIGMRIVYKEDELQEAISSTKKLALANFADDSLIIEKYLLSPRHIEIQLLADEYGNYIYLGERECSIQRRYQKIIEEAPSPIITPTLRKQMGEIAVKAGKAINYTNAGTVEFIYSDGKFYFMEMNTRLQVEHTITEIVTGIDLVKEQIKIAAGEKLGITQKDIKINGHAIECRIYAEDPTNNFLPSPGRITNYRAPGGIGVRVDSGLYTGCLIPPYYDPLISKLITYGKNRNEAIERMKRALYEYIIAGIKTNIPFLIAIMNTETFIGGNFSTHFIKEHPHLYDEVVRIINEEKLEAKLEAIFKQEPQDNNGLIAAIVGSLIKFKKEKQKGVLPLPLTPPIITQPSLIPSSPWRLQARLEGITRDILTNIRRKK